MTSEEVSKSVISPLVGICLCDETSTIHNQVIGTVHVTPESHSQILTQFRNEVTTLLFDTLKHRDYLFLSPHGWEINENLENVVKLRDILSAEGKVNIRFTYNKPRLGIVIEGSPDLPVGFVFCNLDCTVADLAHEISSQLPSLYKSLLLQQFCFLDRNLWPISKRQESMLTVMEVVVFHTVKIRCNQNAKIKRVSTIENSLPSIENIERKQLELHNSLPNDGEDLAPINENNDSTDQRLNSLVYTDVKAPSSSFDLFEILLSYVHTEAGPFAVLLKNALEYLGYRVFLDVHCIESGRDWQDVLNDAITNCSLFVPLITMQYGQTLWTNREVKLADVLGKLILPVNFNKTWPPKCLAIQFATTQYIHGDKVISGDGVAGGKEVTLESITESDASKIAAEIAERYRKELSPDEESTNSGLTTPPLLKKESTVRIVEDSCCPSPTLKVFLTDVTRRKSTIKSYGSNLPQSLPERYRKSIFESRQGKPFIVISCCKEQKDFAQSLVTVLEKKDYEVWCSCDIDGLTDEEKPGLFQEKVNEAGAVIFVLSKEFAEDTFCEQQVYYCEQRKRIIPLIYEPLEMPNWMATLIGTSTFIDCKSQSYLSAMLDRVGTLLNPQKAVDELNQVVKRKTEVESLCSQLEQELPEGQHMYVSGGTKFYSKCGEAICKEIGKQLARVEEIILITGGFYGVGETVGRSFFEERERMKKPHGVCHVIAIRDEQDKSTQTRQNPDRTFQRVPYGDTLFFGNSVRQREMLTPRVIDLCILVEGGPGAAFEAQQFIWNGNHVVPIRVTGGAAGGSFNVPSTILVRPPNVSESDWSLLGDEDASPSEIASAVVKIVKALKNPDISIPGIRSRSNTESGSVAEGSTMPLKRGKAMFRRSDTAPKRYASAREDGVTETSKNIKRSLTEKNIR